MWRNDRNVKPSNNNQEREGAQVKEVCNGLSSPFFLSLLPSPLTHLFLFSLCITLSFSHSLSLFSLYVRISMFFICVSFSLVYELFHFSFSLLLSPYCLSFSLYFQSSHWLFLPAISQPNVQRGSAHNTRKTHRQVESLKTVLRHTEEKIKRARETYI